MTNLEDKPFLTIKEVSNLIGLSVSTINRLVKKGEFPPKWNFFRQFFYILNPPEKG